MSLYERLKNQAESLALVGLGYVGMPIAVAFAKKGLHVIGFDLNKKKIALYQSGLFQAVLYPQKNEKNWTVHRFSP